MKTQLLVVAAVAATANAFSMSVSDASGQIL